MQTRVCIVLLAHAMPFHISMFFFVHARNNKIIPWRTAWLRSHRYSHIWFVPYIHVNYSCCLFSHQIRMQLKSGYYVEWNYIILLHVCTCHRNSRTSLFRCNSLEWLQWQYLENMFCRMIRWLAEREIDNASQKWITRASIYWWLCNVTNFI